MTASAFAGRGRYSIYTGRVTNWPMVLLSAALAVPLLAMSKVSHASASDLAFVLLMVVGVVVNGLTGTSVRTATGPNGVSVRFGLVGWPRCTYRLDQIERAEVIDLPPWRVAFGFWWTPWQTCCTVRSGPNLQLTLHSGRRVTITVPDAHAAVAALHDAAGNPDDRNVS